jgi:hypothetical protein
MFPSPRQRFFHLQRKIAVSGARRAAPLSVVFASLNHHHSGGSGALPPARPAYVAISRVVSTKSSAFYAQFPPK